MFRRAEAVLLGAARCVARRVCALEARPEASSVAHRETRAEPLHAHRNLASCHYLSGVSRPASRSARRLYLVRSLANGRLVSPHTARRAVGLVLAPCFTKSAVTALLRQVRDCLSRVGRQQRPGERITLLWDRSGWLPGCCFYSCLRRNMRLGHHRVGGCTPLKVVVQEHCRHSRQHSRHVRGAGAQAQRHFANVHTCKGVLNWRRLPQLVQRLCQVLWQRRVHLQMRFGGGSGRDPLLGLRCRHRFCCTAAQVGHQAPAHCSARRHGVRGHSPTRRASRPAVGKGAAHVLTVPPCKRHRLAKLSGAQGSAYMNIRWASRGWWPPRLRLGCLVPSCTSTVHWPAATQLWPDPSDPIVNIGCSLASCEPAWVGPVGSCRAHRICNGRP